MNGNNYYDINQQAQIEALRMQIRQILSKILTKEAMERLGRVRIVNEELANQVELYLVQLYQTGQIKELITDKKLKEILKIVTSKRNFKIRRI